MTLPKRVVAVACLALGLSLPAHADFYLIVHASNPQAKLSQKEALDLFMGRTRAFPNGDLALIFDLQRDNPRRGAFYAALTGLPVGQVNSYWARLMFSGQSMPPQPLPDETSMLTIVRRNPSALGWVTREPSEAALRTVLVIREDRAP